MKNQFSNIYENKKVLVTGHTGFKGSWLCLWLSKMGADVIGYSLEAPTNPNHFELLNLDMISIIADIKDDKKLDEVFSKYNPDIVFHLAAQALVRVSYENPLETYETNVIGTLKILEVCRKYKIKAIVNITSDKAYENKEWIWGYKEEDRLGGFDPYSSSKACADILVNSYRNSYFNLKDYKKTHNTLIASCRAGNVIGGGDWAKDRLIADMVLNASCGRVVKIRNPKSTRPWQHVLEALSGYLLIGQKLLEGKKEFAQAWNFGPSNENNKSVEEVIKISQKYWGKIQFEVQKDENQPYEANLLRLDCTKAHIKLNWKPVWNSDKTFKRTIKWYKNFYKNKKIFSVEDLDKYVALAKKKGYEWVK